MSTGKERVRTVARWALGIVLCVAGVGHLTAQRVEFQAQVPSWFPIDADVVVVVSGVVEVLLGLALIFAGSRIFPEGSVAKVGLVVAAFFIVIFPGNIAQFFDGVSAFGLDTDAERFIRLWFQPVLVLWALWSTGGWTWLRDWLRSKRAA